MKILVACEESQAVTIEFRKLGHEAYSCDIEPCSGGHPEWHLQQDVIPLLNGNCGFKTCDETEHRIEGKWDMILAFPPCTDLASSGARWFGEKRADGRQQRSKEFFLLPVRLQHVGKQKDQRPAVDLFCNLVQDRKSVGFFLPVLNQQLFQLIEQHSSVPLAAF